MYVHTRGRTKEASESTYSTYRRDTWSHVGNHAAERKNSSGLCALRGKRLNDYLCSHVCACVCVRRRVLVTACEAAFQKEERYLIIPCAPTQVIQIIWTLSIGADGHYRAYICNLLPFKCILEKRERERKKRKRQSRLLNIHPGGQTATVMNTTLSENYSVLYPVVVEDEKGSRRQVDGRAHARARARTTSIRGWKKGRRAEESKHASQDPP